MKTGFRPLLVFALVWCVSRSAVYLLPGDPAEYLVHESLVEISPSSLREKMDLDRSPLARILSIPKNRSLIRNESAQTLLGRAATRSAILALLTLAISIPLTFGGLFIDFGTGPLRALSRFAGFMLASVPVLVLGPLLLRTLPLANPLMPAFVLALHLAAFWHRALSKQLVRALPASSVPGARAIGFPEWRVFYRNLLAPSLGGFLAFFGTQLGVLLNGSLLVETLFQWHGLGSLLADSVLSRDYPVIELSLLLIALLTLLAQHLGYVLQRRWDPRISS
ncbi:MAG: ABC transporter permease subunit [Proteobacteria bacterium]|nr:ABC transporter permease subunit [Pseudomonadota bacterium]